jgi:hypothetical protein
LPPCSNASGIIASASMVSIAPAAKAWAWSPFVVHDRRVLSSHCSTRPSPKRPKNVRDPSSEGENAAGGHRNRRWIPAPMNVRLRPKRFDRDTGIVLKEGIGVNLSTFDNRTNVRYNGLSSLECTGGGAWPRSGSAGDSANWIWP